MSVKKSLSLFLVLVFAVFLSVGLIWHGLNLDEQSLSQSKKTNQQVLGDNAASQASSSPTEGTQAYLISKVIDGDTFEVQINGQMFKVRMIGIDTPETVDPRRAVGCFGKKASQETKRLLEGKSVILTKDVSETDKYNRLLRYVFLPIGQGETLFVNDYLVREGFAKILTYPPDIKYDQRFRQAEKEARDNLRGLWGECK